MTDSAKIKKSGSRKRNLFDKDVDVESYNNIARHSDLNTLQLITSDFRLQPSFFSANEELALSQKSTVESLKVSEEIDYVMGIFKLEVLAKVGRKHALVCRNDYLVVYDLPEGATANEAKAFCSKVGLFAVYPYFRTYVSMISGMANAELPTLPVLSAGPVQQPKPKEK